MGRLARHRKIKNVTRKGKADPSLNAPPPKKDEAEFRKIMEEWNKPQESRKKKRQQQQEEGPEEKGETTTTTTTTTTSTTSSRTATKRKREQEKQQGRKKKVAKEEDEWIELDLDDDPNSGPVSLNALIEKKKGGSLDSLLTLKDEDEDDDGKKKKKKKKNRRSVGKIENIDVKHDELEDLKQPNVKLPEMKKGESYANYVRRLRAATGKELRQHAMAVEKKPLRESRKQHLKKREEKKKSKKGGNDDEHTDATILNALTTAREQGLSSQPLFISERKEEKVRFFDQVEEPPKLQVPLNAKKQLQLAKRREEEKKKNQEEAGSQREGEKKTVAQRSMELLRERAVANYKLAKLREKQKRSLGTPASSTTTKGKKKEEEPAASYL